jgi:hypothetical protein
VTPSQPGCFSQYSRIRSPVWTHDTDAVPLEVVRSVLPTVLGMLAVPVAVAFCTTP